MRQLSLSWLHLDLRLQYHSGDEQSPLRIKEVDFHFVSKPCSYHIKDIASEESWNCNVDGVSSHKLSCTPETSQELLIVKGNHCPL